jgi:hypothetical protein
VSHLGERLTALVDGELGHDERDRALAHLAVCAECRAEADALRRLKSRLRALPGPPPAVDFLRRLTTLGEPATLGEPGDVTQARVGAASGARSDDTRDAARIDHTGPEGALPGVPAAALVSGRPYGVRTPGGRPRPGRPRTRRPDRRASARGGRAWGRAGAVRRDGVRGRHLLAGAATLAVLGVGAVSFAAGAQPERVPQVTPALERFAVEHALSSGEVPMTDTIMMRERRVGP